MTPLLAADYFSSPENIQLALSVAFRWMGTPFAPRTRVCGAGVDCVQLAGAFYIETGVVTHFTPPPYHLDAGAHLAASQVTAYVEAMPDKFRLLWKYDGKNSAVILPVIIGDLLGFKFGRVVHHVGVVVNPTGSKHPPEFLHVWRGHVVCSTPLDDPHWLNRLAVVYRPLAAQQSTTPTLQHSISQ